MRRAHYTPTQRRRLARHAYQDACVLSLAGGCWVCAANISDALLNVGWRPPEPCGRCGQWLSRPAQVVIERAQQREEAAA